MVSLVTVAFRARRGLLHEEDVDGTDPEYEEEDHGYMTTLWFVYKGDNWNSLERGALFYVPDDTPDGYLTVRDGLFSIEVWSASILADKYDIGDTITIKTQIVTNVNTDLAFHHEWRLASES